MRKFRLPIWTLLVLVLFFAVAFGALKNPSESVASAVFSLTVGLLCVSPVVALASVGRKRLAWLAFFSFGSAYLGLIFFGHLIPTPRFVLSGWVAAGLDHLERMIDPSITTSDQNSELDPLQIQFQSFSAFDVVDVKNSPKFRRMMKTNEFRQIGHSIATLSIGLVAALVVTLIIKPDQRKQADTHASERP